MSDIAEFLGLPTTLYIPTQRARPGDSEIQIELRDLSDGQRALLVFTSIDSLVAGCGDQQPWMAVRASALRELRARLTPGVVLFDGSLPEFARRQPPDDVPDADTWVGSNTPVGPEISASPRRITEG